MRRFIRTVCALLALLVAIPLPVSGATYTFSGGSMPACSGKNGWTLSGTTYTCTSAISLAAGDVIAPAAGITVIANAGWTLGGNNVIGSASARVSLRSTYGDITVGSGSTVNGDLVSGSGDISITNTVVKGSLTTDGRIFISGGSVSGNVSSQNGVSATGGATIGGNVLATNGAVTLNGGAVTGSVISNCCTVTSTNTNISGGVRSDRNTVSINGGTITGGVYSSGGSGIIINNATVTGGDITATSVPISINNSTIGSPVSLVDITNNNTISINSSTVNGSVTAAGWSGSLTITGNSDVTISCYPTPVPATEACGGTGGGGTVHHYEIDVPAAGLTCENTTLPVRACATSASPCTANLATTTTTTTLTASAGTFANSGGATISFTGIGGYVLSAPNPAVVSLALAAPSGASLSCFRFEGTTRTPLGACQFEVKNSMFRFTVPNFSAGEGAPFTIEAVRQDDQSRKCVSFVPAGGVKMWAERVNPASGTMALSFSYGSPVQTVALPLAEPAAGNIPLAFDNLGAAGAGVNYLDVGMVKLKAKWNATEGESTFVVKPLFAVSGLTCGDGTPNPGASGPAGSKFCRAGDPFGATVRAVARVGATLTATPNFGRETPPESVILAAEQVSPAVAPAVPGVLQGGAGLVKDSGDPSVARSATLSWSEVGVISLTPKVADGDYLGAGDAAGIASALVGRFYPHHFSTAVTAPMDCPAGLAAGCPESRATPAKGMSYAGRPFSVNVSAMSAGGTITRNYSGDYARAVALAPVSALGGPDAPSAPGAGTLSGGTIAPTSFSNGTASITNGVTYAFDAPPGAPTSVFVRASETGGDGVTSRLVPNSASEEGGIRLAQGRIRMSNVFGNGKAALDMPVEAQYWSGNSWVRNASDNTALAMSAITSAPALAGIESFTFAQGSGKIVLRSASAGSYKLGFNLGGAGAPFVSCVAGLAGGTPANAPWLRSRNGSCAASAAYAADPTAVATFGIFSPETRKTIHVRELY